MRGDPPDPLLAVGDGSVGGERRHGSNNNMVGGINSERSKSINYCSLAGLPVIGDKISRKKDNMIRFYFENFNGIRSHVKGVDKGKYFSGLINKLEIDCFGAAETNLQWEMVRTTPKKVLYLAKETKCVHAYNSNEHNTIKQQGGTCVTIMEKYGEYVKEMGKDPSSLGRWSWIKVKGNNDITTIIISAYLPCRSRKTSMLSTYAQQKRYWAIQGIDTCPRAKAREDLIEFVSDKKREGHRIILMIDGNENMRTGKLAEVLKKEPINMRDAIRDRVGNYKFPTWFRGQEQIDAI